MRKLTTEEFIEKSKLKHNDVYDYSKTEYINSEIKVRIVCQKHGEFSIIARNHLSGQGCPECGIDKRSKARTSNINEFIEKANKTHKNRFDYFKTIYVNSETKVIITCPEHGDFSQNPSAHLSGQGCPECARNTKKTTTEFIDEVKNIFGNLYDYSKTEYAGANKKIIVTCNVHGDFSIAPSAHLSGQGCPKCAGKNKNTEEFIKQCAEKHSNLYDYSKTVYSGVNNEITIVCPIHGEFLSTPHAHLHGRGCPKCSMSKLEKECMNFFESQNIQYEYQKKFDWLCNKTHKRDYMLRADFYLEQYHTVIECQGVQHFESNLFFDKKSSLFERQQNDIRKYHAYKEHDINVIYFTNESLLKHSGSLFIYNDNLFSDIDLIMARIR